MYKFLNFLCDCLSKLSPRTQYKIAMTLAFLGYHVLRIRRRLVEANIRTAFPHLSDAEVHKMAKATYENFAMTVIEFLSAKDSSVTDHCQFENVHYVTDALAYGKGLFVLCCHLGNWEVFCAAVNRHIRPAKAIVKKVGSDDVNRFVEEKRRSIGFDSIMRKGKMDAIRGIKQIIQSNDIVGVMLDQSKPGEPRIPFFGKPAKTNTTLSVITRRYPAPIVPGYIRRVSMGHHIIEFLPPILMPNATEDRELDVIEESRLFNEAIENLIKRAPEQYFWFHNRWK